MDLQALAADLQLQVDAYTAASTSHDPQQFALREQIRAQAMDIVHAIDGSEQTMRTIARAYASCTALKICVDLDVARHLRPTEEKSLEQLAAETSCHHRILRPVLRLLAHQGIFEQTERATWCHTELSLLMTRLAFRAWLVQILEPKYRVASYLPRHLKEKGYDCPSAGEVAFNSAYSTQLDFYTYNNEHDHAAAENFAVSMEELARDQLNFFAKSYDLGRIHPETLFVDVAGGLGNLSYFLANRFSRASFLIQDHPTIIEHAQRDTPMPMQDRVRFMAHDMFSPQPVYDRQRYPRIVFLLKIILHDHGDRECISLLWHLLKVMKAGDRILIIDTVIPETGGGLSSCTSDLLILGMSGSHHRTFAEFCTLIRRCDESLIIQKFTGGAEEFDGMMVFEVRKPEGASSNLEG